MVSVDRESQSRGGKSRKFHPRLVGYRGGGQRGRLGFRLHTYGDRFRRRRRPSGSAGPPGGSTAGGVALQQAWGGGVVTCPRDV